MPEKNNHEKQLHGNRAKIEPKKHVESMFITSKVAISSARLTQSEEEQEDAVEYAKKFVDENKK